MADHALIEAGPVPVVGPVHLVMIVGMSELKQPAATGLVSAFDELERALGNTLLPIHRENSGQGLHAQIENLEELAVSADTAPLYRAMHGRPLWETGFHLKPGWTKEPRSPRRPSCTPAP